MKLSKVILILVSCILLTSCEDPRPLSSDQVQHLQQEKLSEKGNASVGMPSITHFQEKQMLKTILEMRDNATNTYTYTQDMNGNLHKLCDSVGYALPASTQYTNPSRIVRENNGDRFSSQVMQQADPNGLFPPSSSEGTWILCKDPKTKKVSPVYAEPRVLVSQFPLN